MTAVSSGHVETLTLALAELFDTPFFPIWLYLIFAISNAMLPSVSDRRAWPGFIVVMALLAGLVYLLGLQREVVAGLAGPVVTMFTYLGIAFSVSLGVDMLVMLLLAGAESLLSRLKGVSVVYGPGES
jgi:hypothetical protein